MACRIMNRNLHMSASWRYCKTNNLLSCSSFMSLHPYSINKDCNYQYARRTQTMNCSNKSRGDHGKSAHQDEFQEPRCMVFGSKVTGDATKEWLELDRKVNSYPSVRKFTAIGTGGHDFVHRMIVSVESVIQKPIPWDQVKQRVSRKGKYVSVNIGPVEVESGKQVQAVYNAMRRDDRMKFFL